MVLFLSLDWLNVLMFFFKFSDNLCCSFVICRNFCCLCLYVLVLLEFFDNFDMVLVKYGVWFFEWVKFLVVNLFVGSEFK